MSAGNAHVNTPAAAWAWLTRQLTNLDEMPGPSIGREWRQFRSEMNGQLTHGTSINDWPSDFWIARTQQVVPFQFMTAVWAIPERLDQWPTLEMHDSFTSALPGRRVTNSAPVLELLARADPVHGLPENNPVRLFYELNESSATHKDEAMISASQIRSWLSTAFGALLRGISLSLIEDDSARELAIQAVTERIAGIDSLGFKERKDSFFDYGCDSLYTTRMTQSGLQADLGRQGQGSDWQQHWSWLSTPQDARMMTATLQLTGLLLVNEPLLAGLTSTIRDGNEVSRKRALCVTRRWLLTAKVLAWLFEALQHNWASVRPQDLACFAFAALSPAWPRRAVAVSHRSAEAKPILSRLNMWKSPHAAVDASYVPAWETNLGMIWNLFAPVPLIARIGSPAYFESEWCRREHEMFQYLIDHADFLEGRAILDIGVGQLAELDASLFENASERSGPARLKPFSAPKDEFPPFSLVLVGEVPSEIDLAILRAAGALRLINLLTRDPELANEVAGHAAAGYDIGVDAPTNNPDGWAAYGELFRDLEAASLSHQPGKLPIAEKIQPGKAGRPLQLKLPHDYPAQDVQLDLVTAEHIPDLSGGQYRLADILAALEWERTLLLWFNNEDYGDKVMVDVSGFSAGDWSTLPHFSVGRGLVALNGFSPIWIMQRAGQNAHLWPGFNGQPIFTRHFDDQFKWLKPVILHPSWLLYYHVNAGLGIGADLEAAMIAAIVSSAGPSAIEVKREAGRVELTVPLPGDFFCFRDDVVSDVRKLPNPPTDPQTQ